MSVIFKTHSTMPVISIKYSTSRSYNRRLWRKCYQAVALQILRSTPAPLSRLSEVEKLLEHHLSNPSSQLHREAEDVIIAQLYPYLHRLITNYSPLNSLQIFEAATTPRAHIPSRFVVDSPHRKTSPGENSAE